MSRLGTQRPMVGKRQSWASAIEALMFWWPEYNPTRGWMLLAQIAQAIEEDRPIHFALKDEALNDEGGTER
jgi:hypothetical protein